MNFNKFTIKSQEAAKKAKEISVGLATLRLVYPKGMY